MFSSIQVKSVFSYLLADSFQGPLLDGVNAGGQADHVGQPDSLDLILLPACKPKKGFSQWKRGLMTP
jgi:hypothetical protein